MSNGVRCVYVYVCTCVFVRVCVCVCVFVRLCVASAVASAAPAYFSYFGLSGTVLLHMSVRSRISIPRICLTWTNLQ